MAQDWLVVTVDGLLPLLLLDEPEPLVDEPDVPLALDVPLEPLELEPV